MLLHEQQNTTTHFRGLEIYHDHIPVRTEHCDLCTNHCSISLANIRNDTVAYGFMCGRDYDTKKHVFKNKAGFDLLKERKKIAAVKPVKPFKHDITIGLPASLHLFEELSLWKRFFNNLSIRTVTSEPYMEPLKTGKCVAGAEFCAPSLLITGMPCILPRKRIISFCRCSCKTVKIPKMPKDSIATTPSLALPLFLP